MKLEDDQFLNRLLIHFPALKYIDISYTSFKTFPPQFKNGFERLVAHYLPLEAYELLNLLSFVDKVNLKTLVLELETLEALKELTNHLPFMPNIEYFDISIRELSFDAELLSLLHI